MNLITLELKEKTEWMKKQLYLESMSGVVVGAQTSTFPGMEWRTIFKLSA
jgi:hypothetical protein